MPGKRIGIGNTADVYEWEEGKVIKLFKEGFPNGAVENEYRNALAVAGYDFDKPEVFGRAEWEGRQGIIYERLDGITLLDWLISGGDLEECGRILAAEHKKIWKNRISGVRVHKNILKVNIEQAYELEQEMRDRLLVTLSGLPDGDNLCHGDYHPGNILLHQDKKVIIDWMNICSGHPYSDIARTIYLIEMTPMPEHVDPDEFTKLRRTITDTYLSELSVDREVINRWMPVIAAARLRDGCASSEVDGIINYLNRYYK